MLLGNQEARDDLLRLSMSAGILRLCRIFFFDEMGTDLCGALRAWFAAFSAGASEVRSPKLTVGFSQSSYILMTYRVVG